MSRRWARPSTGWWPTASAGRSWAARRSRPHGATTARPSAPAGTPCSQVSRVRRLSATLTTQRTAPAPAATTMAIVIAARPDPPIFERLLGQLNELGIQDVRIVAPDLRQIAEVAREAEGGIVLLHGDIATNTEALAGLIVDPRIVNGILVGRGARPGAAPLRTRGTTVASAGSDAHKVTDRNAAFLGVLKVGPTQRELLVATAERVAPLGSDVLELLVVGLVRSGVPMRTASLRGM